MAPGKNKGGKKKGSPKVASSVKDGLNILLKSFRDDETSQEYMFPPSLTTEERAYIHESARLMGMKSKSHGKNADRRIVVTKTNTFSKKKIPKLKILPNTLEKTAQLLKNFPLTPAELEYVVPLTDQIAIQSMNGQNTHADCLNHYVPVIPPPLKPSAQLEDRKKLPTWTHREDILDLISKNQVIMITGDTGSGKTTQIPQFLMEQYAEKKQPVRIICTQPRRIAALSVAERVANERSEPLGSTVGYQIRLESRMSSKTALVFCTTGILLRTLMYEDSNLDRVTHLIIDEVHERDRFCDFLLGVIRSRLTRFPNLRLILMSAALDVNVFSNYFTSCPVFHVQGKCYPVQEFFLEDVLQLTDHLSQGLEIGVWDTEAAQANGKANWFDKNETVVFDSWIENIFVQDNPEILQCLATAIKDGLMPVNYRHAKTNLTPLMIVAARGRDDLVEQFLKLGADPTLSTGEWTAMSLASSMQHGAVVHVLSTYLKERAESLLQIYNDHHNEETVNVDLIMDVLHMIEQKSSEGAVLVFLPGYEEIMNLRDRILYNDPRFANNDKHEVFTLHSSMQSGDQRRVFLRPPKGKRKIVLSTNLAETSITIDDIVYVIDTGKVKVKSYDAMTGVSALKAEWVPQASAIQRKGRAGRCQEGICFHLFSRQRYESFQKYQIPEIFRVPLEELCLQSKNLAPVDLSIADFIGLVPEAPNPAVIKRAVKMLQWMDALDPWENVTDLGRLLLELPVEPRLGKMLLTATVLHCLDPVLTIVCCLSYRDPFVLPSEPQEKKAAAARKLELSAGTLSDHMAMLRAFNLWQVAKANGRERDFCYKNYLSLPTMQIIHQLRSQILDQLRKSGFVRSFQELNTNASSWVAIKSCILSGLYPQVARATRSGQLGTRLEPVVRLHMTSALLGEKFEGSNAPQKNIISSLPSEWMIYEEISRYGGTQASLRCVTLVHPVVLTVFGGHCRLAKDAIKEQLCEQSESPPNPDEEDEDLDNGDEEDDDDDYTDISSDELDEELLKELSEGLDDLDLAGKFCRSPLPDERCQSGVKAKKDKAKLLIGTEFHLDDWIHLKMDNEAAHRLFSLRQKWQALFARRMRDPLSQELPGDKQVLDTLLDILAQEEKAYGLPPSPELTGVVDMPRGKYAPRSNNYNNRPNQSAQPYKPVRDLNDPLARNGVPAKNWRPDNNGPPRQGGSGRINPSASASGPRTRQSNYDQYSPSPRSSWRDLGNLKYATRTGFPDIDFAADSASLHNNGGGGTWRGHGSKSYGPSANNATAAIANERFSAANSFRSSSGLESEAKSKNGSFNPPPPPHHHRSGVVTSEKSGTHQKRNPKNSLPPPMQHAKTAPFGKGPANSQPFYSSGKGHRMESAQDPFALLSTTATASIQKGPNGSDSSAAKNKSRIRVSKRKTGTGSDAAVAS